MNPHSFRFLISLTLSFCIIFSSMPFQRLAQAQSSTETGANVAPSTGDEHERGLEQLRNSFLTEQGEAAHLDPFMLTRQVVVDERPENIKAVVDDEALRDYEERVAFLEDQKAQLEKLQDQTTQKLLEVRKSLESSSTLAVTPESEIVKQSPRSNESKARNLELIVEDIKSRIGILDIELQEWIEHRPGSENPIELDSFVDQELKVRHYFGRNLNLILENSNGQTRVVEQAAFTESLSPRFSSVNPVADSDGWLRDNTKLLIANHRGEVMHKFLNSVEAVFFFGEYLVYVEQETSVSQDGVLPVRFIDLSYFRTNIGNGPLPVFTLPVKVGKRPENYAIDKGRLVIGDHSLAYEQLKVIGQVQRVMFNINVALVDPEAYDNVRPLVSEITEFMAKSLKAQGKAFEEQLREAFQTSGLIDQASMGLNARENFVLADAQDLVDKSMKDGKLSSEEYQDITRALENSDKMTAANQALAEGRRFTTRVRLLYRFLTQPRPEGAPKLLKALVILAVGKQAERRQVWELGKGSVLRRFSKYGLGIGGTILAGTQLPEPYKIHLFKSFDLISAISQHFQGYLVNIDFGKAYGALVKDAFITSTTGVTYIVDSYFADGKWPQFLYGVGRVVLVPLQAFSMIHFAVNGVKLLAPTLSIRGELPGPSIGRRWQQIYTREQQLTFKNLASLVIPVKTIEAFKVAAAQDQKRYWQRLAEAEREANGQAKEQEVTAEELEKQWTPEQVRLLSDRIDRLHMGRESIKSLEQDIRRGEIRKRTSLGEYFRTLLGYVKINRFATQVESDVETRAKEAGLSSGDKLRTALRTSFLSYAALNSTYKFGAGVWGYLFMGRSFFFFPVKWFMAVIYPNFFHRTVGVREGRQHFPSKYNGGLTLLPQITHRLLSEVVQASVVGRFKSVDRIFNKLFLTKEALANLRAFEAQVIPIESVAIEVAKKRAQKALIQSMDDPNRIAALFSSADRRGDVSTGIRNLSDPKIRKLQRRDQLYYRAYFTRTYELFMQEALGEVVAINGGPQMDPRVFAKTLTSRVRSNEFDAEKLQTVGIGTVEEAMEQNDKFSQVTSWSERITNSGVEFLTRLNLQFRHRLLQSVHPSDGPTSRFLESKKKMNEPRAMERATRAEVATMTTGVPLALLSSYFLYAGVQTGFMMPFAEGAIDTDTHYNYMSRYLFYTGFIPGVIMGMLGNTWLKLQEDARIDGLDGFDKAIKQADQRKGYWRFYLKNAFKHPTNKWKDNQLLLLKLIYYNIPAVAVTFLASSYWGLGRFDIGAFMAGYIVMFVTPFMGFQLKMDQAFELSSKWVYDKIPRSLRAHPDAQKYIGRQLQKRRIFYSYFENLFSIIVTENIVGDMLALKDNVRYGTRAFLRNIFGGETPTTLVVNLSDKMISAFGSIPGVESAAEAVKTFFAHGYEAFDRFPGELTSLDPSVEQVQLPPDLPKSTLGALVGNVAGMVTTVGGFTAAPYGVSAALQMRREKRLQKKGEALRCKKVFTE